MAMHDRNDPDAVATHYEQCIQNGCDPKLAEMLSRRSAPGIKTDATHFAGIMGRQFANNPEMGDALSAELRAMGGSPVGKVYRSSLARYAGDPEAWVDSRSDIKAICERRGWGCEGGVTVKSPEMVDPTPTIPLDPKVVTDEVELAIERNPEIAPTPKERERLWNETYEKRLPPKYRDKRTALQMAEEMKD